MAELITLRNKILKKYSEDLINSKDEEIRLLGIALKEFIKHTDKFNKHDIDSFIFDYKESLEDGFHKEEVLEKIVKIEQSIFALFSSFEIMIEESKS